MPSMFNRSDANTRDRRSLLRHLHLDLSRVLDKIDDAQLHDEAARWLQTVASLLNLPEIEDQAMRRAIGDLILICTRGRLQFLLSSHGINFPPYNHFEDFYSNVQGPWDVPLKEHLDTPLHWEVLGHRVGVPIGVPASALTVSANWIEYFARRGFNILTFKTMRSLEWHALPQPNWIFLEDARSPLSSAIVDAPFIGDENAWPDSPMGFSMANSFGVPSFSPDRWQAEVDESLQRLSPAQLLIVSVMGSAEVYQDEQLVDDFCLVARLAEEAGAPVIELNLSCPNTIASDDASKSLIAESPETTLRVVAAVREKLTKRDTKLVVKLSALADEVLRAVIVRAAPYLDGISGINTVQAQVRRPSGSIAFPSPTSPGRGRPAGISGVAIRDLGLRFVEHAHAVIEEENLDLAIIGMGGVMSPSDFSAYVDRGAAAVQTATAAFLNPNLGQEVADVVSPSSAGISHPLQISEMHERVLALLSKHELLEDVQIAGFARLTPGTVSRVVSDLVSLGRVQQVPAGDERPKYALAE